jgi:hypothetical protein
MQRNSCATPAIELRGAKRIERFTEGSGAPKESPDGRQRMIKERLGCLPDARERLFRVESRSNQWSENGQKLPLILAL